MPTSRFHYSLSHLQWHFPKLFVKLKGNGRNSSFASYVSLATFRWKETYELSLRASASRFRKCHENVTKMSHCRWDRRCNWYEASDIILHVGREICLSWNEPSRYRKVSARCHCTTTHCNTLQHTVTHCDTLWLYPEMSWSDMEGLLRDAKV